MIFAMTIALVVLTLDKANICKADCQECRSEEQHSSHYSSPGEKLASINTTSMFQWMFSLQLH